MKKINTKKQLKNKIIEDILMLLNLAGFMFILGTIGAIENFHNVSKMQILAVVLIMIIFYLEIKILEIAEKIEMR